jgi:hypothetical protein
MFLEIQSERELQPARRIVPTAPVFRIRLKASAAGIKYPKHFRGIVFQVK